MRRPSASARGYGGKRWRWTTREVFQRDGYICRACGLLCVPKEAGMRDVGRWPHCDHIVPKPAGSDEMENLQTLCGACHSRKTARERGGGG